MRTVFDKLAQSALLRTILYVVLGILMLIFPAIIMNIIVYILAGYAIVMGAINLVTYFRHRQEEGTSGFGVFSGVLLVVLGIVMIIFSRAIISILPIFLGALLILGGAVNLARALSSGKTIGRQNVFLIVINALIVVGGILVIANPFGSAVILFRVFGAAVLIMGISELVTYFVYRKLGKEE